MMMTTITNRSRSPLRALFLLGGLVLAVATCRLDMLLRPSTTRVHPALAVVPTSVVDSARAGSDDVRRAAVAITNGGRGGEEFEWEAEERHSWIRLSPRDGKVPDTLTITLDPEDLDAGTYEGTITITASGIIDSQVTIAVTFIAQRPGLVVTPRDIEYETNVGSGARFSDTLRISNSGDGALEWTARNDRSWLTLGRKSGSGPGTVPLTINSGGLEPGTYRDEIVVTAPGATGSPARVDVTLRVFAPGLAVNPGSVRDTATVGSTTPRTHRLRVTNSGSGSMTWSATKGAPWVSLSTAGGGAPADVDVTLDPSGLAPGTHRDTIVFTSPEATNDPVKVPVELAISQSTLIVAPAAISHTAGTGDATPRVETLTVSNGGPGMFLWTAVDDQSWIGLSPTVGTAPPATAITVTLDPRGLPPGTHEGRITITAPGAAGSPVTVPVTFVISRECETTSVTPDVVISGSLSGADCAAPHRPGSFADIYAVSAAAGDTLSLRLTASFDAHLVLTDGAGTVVLAENDECPGESRTACIRDFRVPSPGFYRVEVTSAQNGETGSYTLTVVRELAPPPPQGIGQFRLDGTTPIAVGATTPETGVVFKATIDDPNVRDSVRLEVEMLAAGSGFANAPTHTSDVVPADGGNGRTVQVQAGGLSDGTGYHWQARACDRTRRCSAWQRFGANADGDADFRVAVPQNPTGPPSSGGER